MVTFSTHPAKYVAMAAISDVPLQPLSQWRHNLLQVPFVPAHCGTCVRKLSFLFVLNCAKTIGSLESALGRFKCLRATSVQNPPTFATFLLVGRGEGQWIQRDLGLTAWAHNPKVGGSNPPPATKLFNCLA